MKKKILMLSLLLSTSGILIASGEQELDVRDNGEQQVQTVNGKDLVIERPINKKKHLNKKYKTLDAALNDVMKKKELRKKQESESKDRLDAEYLISKRASIQKGVNLYNMSITDKRMMSGKIDAIKRVSTRFEYYNDSVYEVFTTPDFISTIKFKEDEEILHIACGDTDNWNIEQTKGGEKDSTYLYIMPVDTDLVTNLSVITTKRAYNFTLYSTKHTFNPMVRFTYPLDHNSMSYDLSKITKVKSVKEKVVENGDEEISKRNDKIVVSHIDDVDFNYMVSSGNYAFTPTKVYSNLVQTVIEMKDTLVESPVLFVRGESGDYEVVNYKQDGNRILVDRKIKQAALKLGNQTVYIKHK